MNWKYKKEQGAAKNRSLKKTMTEEKLLALILGILIGTWFPFFKNAIRKARAPKGLFIVDKIQSNCWKIKDKETKKIVALLYSRNDDHQKAQGVTRDGANSHSAPFVLHPTVPVKSVSSPYKPSF